MSGYFADANGTTMEDARGILDEMAEADERERRIVQRAINVIEDALLETHDLSAVPTRELANLIRMRLIENGLDIAELDLSA